MKATNIKIRVSENNQEMVFVTLPMTALDNLEFLIPENVLTHIRDQGIVISQIIQTVKDSDFKAQDLLNLQAGVKHYHVWID